MLALCLLVACAGSFSMTSAFTNSTPKPLMTSVGLLGVGVVTGGVRLIYLDDANPTSTAFTLPELSANDGVIYFIKKGPTNNSPVLIYPASGEKIDGNQDLEWVLDQTGEYVGIVGDVSRGSWWIIQEGASGYEMQ